MMLKKILSSSIIAALLFQSAAVAFEGGEVLQVQGPALAPVEIPSGTNLKALGRGLYDKVTGSHLVLTCKDEDSKETCENVQFALFTKDFKSYYLDRPFPFSDFKKTKNDLFLSWLSSVELERSGVFIQKSVKLKDTLNGDMEGAAASAALAGAGIYTIMDGAVVFGALLGAPVILLYGSSMLLMASRLNQTLQTSDFKKIFSFEKMEKSVATTVQTDRIHWQFKPRNANYKSFRAILSLLTPDDEIINRFSPEHQCKFGKVEFDFGNRTTENDFQYIFSTSNKEEVQNLFPRKIRKKIPKEILQEMSFADDRKKFNSQKLLFSFLRLSLNYAPQDPNAPTLRFYLKDRFWTKVGVELENVVFENGTDKVRAHSRVDDFSHWQKLVAKLSTCERLQK